MYSEHPGNINDSKSLSDIFAQHGRTISLVLVIIHQLMQAFSSIKDQRQDQQLV